jgi:glutamate dehydrogenase/leucine dehydrogenase
MSTHVTAPDAISPRVLAALQDAAHEQLLIRRGDRTGLYTIVAIHSTALGPSLGGCRMWRYPDLEHAVNDALRLSGAMR